ncbi:MAG: nucleotide exchange factor GrpE [Cellulosilyticaceae bacterium]
MNEEQNTMNEEILEEENLEETVEGEIVEEEPAEETKESDKANEYLERLQRLMAEFDNYRKRTEKEKAGIYDLAISNTFTELLPIIDNFERALKVECQDKNFFDGVSMIYKQLVGVLENADVTPIEAVGATFDPNLHNAVLHIEDEELGENIVAEELQKGYLYKEKVIRHSIVKVAN